MNVEDKLCSLHQKENSYLVGSATIGVHLILKALCAHQQRIALPNNICFNVPLAILFSDNIPVFLDISPVDLGLSVESLKKSKDDFDIVYANHSYGSVCNIEEIVRFCRENNKFLIEDFALAQGATLYDRPVGSFGDVSVVSFGAGKIVSVDHGGAILSNDNKLIQDIRALENTFSEYREQMGADIDSLSRKVRSLYNQFYGTEYWRHNMNFYNTAKEYKNSFFYKFPREKYDMLSIVLNELSDNIDKRKAKAEILTVLFEEENIENISIICPADGSVYWRFNIYVKEKRNELLKHLLNIKYPVSSWYPSVNVLFGNEFQRIVTPNSDRMSDEILNIWVNEEVDEGYLNNIVKDISDKCKN